MIKINWDAVVDNKKGRVGLGVVACDGNRRCLAARSMTHKMVLEQVMAEALVVIHALIMGTDLGLNAIIFEGDALQVINAVNSQEGCMSSYGHFVEDIQASLQSLGIAKFKNMSFEKLI